MRVITDVMSGRRNYRNKMKTGNINVYLVLIAIISVALETPAVQGKDALPSFLKICRRSDTKLKECMKESIETLRPLLVDGIPEFDIPSIEPLIIPEVIIDQGNGPVSVKSIYRDINVHGPSEFVIKNVRFDFDKDKVKVKIWFPWLQVNTNYSMDGRILMMPIKGSGLSYGNYTDIDATVSMKAQRLQKGNETFYNIKDFFVDFNIGKASLFFDNLFNGEPQLGEAMNLFLNDNWKSVSKEIKPVLEDTIAKIFKKFSNKIFHKYPIRVLFPE